MKTKSFKIGRASIGAIIVLLFLGLLSTHFIHKHQETGKQKMKAWEKRHRPLDVLMTEGPKGFTKKVIKKLSLRE